MRSIKRIVSFIVVSLIAGCSPQASWTLMPGQHAHSFEERVTYMASGHFLLFLPHEYGATDRKWPMIIFLHGSGERGSDLELVKKQGPPMIVESQPDFPFIVVSPQVPEGSAWSPDVIDALLKVLVKKLAVDNDRIYLTGLSMGGYGTWACAAAYPHWFAAIAPVCGGGDPGWACKLKDIPVWAFHGAKDDVVPIKEEQDMVDALKECGGDVQFTIYPEGNHNAWTETYANPELYKWFLRQSK